jgi:type IX secretion system PorP/SprF family membrane protein
MKYLFSLLSIVSASFVSTAQDILPAQFRAAPLLYNPASAGLTKEDIRASALYQQQWGNISPRPSTWAYASVDMNMLKNKLPQGDAFGIGISTTTRKYEEYYNYLRRADRSGSFTVAYHKGLGLKKAHHLSAGIQTTLVNKSMDRSRAMPLPGGPGAPIKDAVYYADYGVGLMYSGEISRRSSLYCGYSLYHPWHPVEVYFEGDSAKVYRRHTALAGWNFSVSRMLTISTNAIFYSQADAQQLGVGSSATLTVNPASKHPVNLQLGGWYYYTEALVPYVAAEWCNIRLGASYGYNMNQFIQATLPAASYEISLVYTGLFRAPDNNWNVPRI